MDVSTQRMYCWRECWMYFLKGYPLEILAIQLPLVKNKIKQKRQLWRLKGHVKPQDQ